MNTVAHINDDGAFVFRQENLLGMPHKNDFAVHAHLKGPERPCVKSRF